MNSRLTPDQPTLVFDLDGTLAHSAPDILGTLNHILDREGVARLAEADALSLVGSGARALVKRAYAAANEPLSEPRLMQLFEDFLVHYESRIADESHLFPGAREALAQLHADGHRLAICTNKTERLARVLIDKFNVTHHFAAICGRDSFEFQKPDHRHLTMTIKAAGGDETNAIMIGDTLTDIETARRAGLPVIGVSFGYADRPMDELAPDLIIHHFDELRGAVAMLAHPALR